MKCKHGADLPFEARCEVMGYPPRDPLFENNIKIVGCMAHPKAREIINADIIKDLNERDQYDDISVFKALALIKGESQ